MTDGSQSTGEYQPGVCNIGGPERRTRRRLGYLGVAFGVVYLGVVLALELPDITALVSAVFFGIGAMGFLQDRLQFCAYYGAVGEYNLGPVSGDPAEVGDQDAHTRDRRRAIQIGVYSAIAGIASGMGGYVLALII